MNNIDNTYNEMIDYIVHTSDERINNMIDLLAKQSIEIMQTGELNLSFEVYEKLKKLSIHYIEKLLENRNFYNGNKEAVNFLEDKIDKTRQTVHKTESEIFEVYKDLQKVKK